MTNRPFNPTDFIDRIARRLVIEFDDASQAGTPGLIGAAKEHPARRQFQSLLPGAAAVGSGLIIDSFGEVSRQQDLVIYEKDFCPVFSINDTPEATYYPCEGVIAVGEVKSALNQKTLDDAFAKIASVKRLRRHAVASSSLVGSTVGFRHYGSTIAMAGTKDEEFDQLSKPLDQIFGFILCGRFDLTPETIVDRAMLLWRAAPEAEAPNIIVSLNDGFIQPMDIIRTVFDSRC